MNNVINLWDTLDNGTNLYEMQLRNATLKSVGEDNEETWANNIKQNIKTYDKDAFDYKFNSLGFRSSEFDNNDPVKILYAGCSVTEGTGLPIEHVWASFLNNQISEEIKKPVNLYSASRGGHSVDAIVRYTHMVIRNNFKPDYVFFMLPAVTRKEIILDDMNLNCMSTYNFISHMSPPPNAMPGTKEIHKNLVNLINYRDSYNSVFKNLLFMNYFLMTEQIPWSFAFWNDEMRPDMIVSPIMAEKNLDTSIPEALRDHYVPGGLVFDHYYDMHPESINPAHPSVFEKKFTHTIARDGVHYGPNSHYNYSKDIYNYLIKKPAYFRELLDKWKN